MLTDLGVVPLINTKCEVADLPLGPFERLVLSKIDGKLAVKDLPGVTNLPVDTIGRIINRLVQLGAVQIPVKMGGGSSQKSAYRATLKGQEVSQRLLPVLADPSRQKTSAGADPRIISQAASPAPAIAATPPASAQPSSAKPAPPSSPLSNTVQANAKSPPPPPVDVEPTSVYETLANWSSEPHKLGPLEKLLLPQVNGRRTLAEIAEGNGLSPEKVGQVIAKLASYGAIQLAKKSSGAIKLAKSNSSEAKGTVSSPESPPRKSAPHSGSSPHVEVTAQSAPQAPQPAATSAGSSQATPLSDADCELDSELQARILDLYGRAGELNYYEILGISSDSDKKSIKRSYYALAAVYHPDKYFGKKLGGFKSKIEQLFSYINHAYDSLSDKAKRAEYDQYLNERAQTLAYEKMLANHDDSSESPIGEIDSGTLRSRNDLEESKAPIPPAGSRISTEDVGTLRGIGNIHLASNAMDADRARRQALASRLRRQDRTTRRSTPEPTPLSVSTQEKQAAANETLRQRYHDKMDAAYLSQAKKHVAEAEAALKKGDIITATAQYRLAVKYTKDPDVLLALEETSEKMNKRLLDAYISQGKHEEQSQKWTEAALSFVKAYEMGKDPHIAERAAVALLREGRDLHRAVKLAEEAVLADASVSSFHITLAEAYAEAGLPLRARGEIDKALQLNPKDKRAKAILSRL